MALYRKKPIVVDAVQYQHGQPCRGVLFTKPRYEGDVFGGEAYCVTIQGQEVLVNSGEWIIAENDGEHYYPCHPSVFEATYEPVTE